METIPNLISWIYYDCEYLERLQPLDQEGLLKQFRRGIQATDGELLIFKFAIHACCYAPHFRASKFPEFRNLELPQIYQQIKHLSIPNYQPIALSKIVGASKTRQAIEALQR